MKKKRKKRQQEFNAAKKQEIKRVKAQIKRLSVDIANNTMKIKIPPQKKISKRERREMSRKIRKQVEKNFIDVGILENYEIDNAQQHFTKSQIIDMDKQTIIEHIKELAPIANKRLELLDKFDLYSISALNRRYDEDFNVKYFDTDELSRKHKKRLEHLLFDITHFLFDEPTELIDAINHHHENLKTYFYNSNSWFTSDKWDKKDIRTMFRIKDDLMRDVDVRVALWQKMKEYESENVNLMRIVEMFYYTVKDPQEIKEYVRTYLGLNPQFDKVVLPSRRQHEQKYLYSVDIDGEDLPELGW